MTQARGRTLTPARAMLWIATATALALPGRAEATGPYYLLRSNQLSETTPTGSTPATVSFTTAGESAYWTIAASYSEGMGPYAVYYYGSGSAATASVQVEVYASFQTNCSTTDIALESVTGTLDDAQTTGGSISWNRTAIPFGNIGGLNVCLKLTVLSITGPVGLKYDSAVERSMLVFPSSSMPDGGAPDGGGGTGTDGGTVGGGGSVGPDGGAGPVTLEVGCDCGVGPGPAFLVACALALLLRNRGRRRT